MRHFQLIALGLAFTLVGCQLPLTLPHAMTPAGQSPTGNTPDLTPTDTKVPRMGTLRFAVRWPERSLPGFTAQVIPISTEKLKFRLSNPTLEGFVPIEQELPRQAGEEIASTTLHLPEGAGYNASVIAYDQDDVAIAANTAANVTVTWGKTTPVPITLDALFAPIIDNLGLGHGTPGQTVSINGDNFERGATVPVVIFPSGVEALGTREGGTITATIPTGAGSGQLKVRVDGVTSTSNVMFQEVRSLELSADGAELGGERDGDGAIASWLGDTFPVRVVGKDTAHVLVPTPALTGWSYPPDGVGMVDPNGVYHAQSLGHSPLSALMGNVSGSREVIVAPPAGRIFRPAGDTKGIVDHSLTRVGDHWLVAWHRYDQKRVYWRMVGDDGVPLGIEHSTVATSTGAERAVRVAALPDGNSAVLAYRGTTLDDRNAIGIQALDPLTGAPIGDPQTIPFETEYDSDQLIDLIAGPEKYALGFMRFNGLKFLHRVSSFTVDPSGSLASPRIQRYDPGSFMYPSPSEDAFSLAASGSTFVVARHFALNGGAGPTSLQLDLLNGEMTRINDPEAVLHERNRVVSVATSGTRTLAVAMEVQPSGTILKLYRYGDDLKQDTSAKLADLNIAGSDPLNWPPKLIWNGEEFILTYARMVGTLENGQVVNRPQAVVQSLGTAGQEPFAPAYPLSKVSQTPTLFPTTEGAMALWLDENRSLVMRRVRYRNVP
jgi:hypothetical protein